MKVVSAEEALKVVKSDDRLFIHTAAAAPPLLIKALTQRAEELKNVKIYQLHTEGDAPYVDEKYASSFEVNALFVGHNVRKAIQTGRGSYIPIFLSEAPILFREGYIKLDVALISVSPPDRHGYCSLGVSVDTSLAAIENARIVIAQINPQMPRTHGDGIIHIKQINYWVEGETPIPEAPMHELTESELQIGQYIAGLIENGSTLQMGIGAIPNAVLAALNNHKNLGIHTEMFSDACYHLLSLELLMGKRRSSMHANSLQVLLWAVESSMISLTTTH